MAIDESSFTGETESSQKTIEKGMMHKSNGNIVHLDNIVFMGTLARSGNGKVSPVLYLVVRIQINIIMIVCNIINA